MIKKQIDSLYLCFFENLLKHGAVGHFVSTRIGGDSGPPFDSLNLSFHVGDAPDNVLQNRARLAGALGFPLKNLTTAKQIHDSRVTIVSEALRGRGAADYKGAIDATDAMVSNVAGVSLMILLADCVPILMYDPTRKVVGVAHAGWEGTLGLIGQKTVAVFQKHFGSSPEDMLVGIGPSIGPCCYQVGPEVILKAARVFGNRQRCVAKESADGKRYLDLWRANLEQLLQFGIPRKNIEIAQICTYDHPHLFFSYRQEKGTTGRFGAGIFIR